MILQEGGEMTDYQEVLDEKYYMYARIFSFIGSILLMIGSIITIYVAYNAYQRLKSKFETENRRSFE